MPASFFQGPELQPGFMVIHGNRLESLRTHPLGPLANEVVLVQSNGISQWLKLALAADPPAGRGSRRRWRCRRANYGRRIAQC